MIPSWLNVAQKARFLREFGGVLHKDTQIKRITVFR